MLPRVHDEDVVPGFIPPPKKSDPTPFDLECADRLQKAAVARRSGGVKYARMRSAREFRLLRESIPANAEERITAALDWYVENMPRHSLRKGRDGWEAIPSPHATTDEKYTPLVVSGDGFRTKFSAIEAARDRAERRRPTGVAVTDRADQLARRLAMQSWPAGCEELLPAVIQLSLDQLDDFYEKLRPLKADKRWGGLARRVLSELADRSHFVENWFRDVCRRLKRWSGWTGTLGDFTLRTASPEFRAVGRGIAERYGDAALWDRLVEVMDDDHREGRTTAGDR